MMKDSGKFDQAKQYLKEITSLMYEICEQDVYIGIVACSSRLTQVIKTSPARGQEEVLKQIDALEASGDTDLSNTLLEARNAFGNTQYRVQHKYMAILTDGYDESELQKNSDPYPLINDQYKEFKKFQPSVRTTTVSLEADKNTEKLLENMASFNDRGAWVHMKCTDDEMVLENDGEYIIDNKLSFLFF